jgi:hypothetical protein
MAGITLTQAQTQLDAYLAAESAVLNNQRYEFNGRMVQRADLESIQRGISTWNQRVTELSRGASGNRRRRTVVAA